MIPLSPFQQWARAALGTHPDMGPAIATQALHHIHHTMATLDGASLTRDDLNGIAQAALESGNPRTVQILLDWLTDNTARVDALFAKEAAKADAEWEPKPPSVRPIWMGTPTPLAALLWLRVRKNAPTQAINGFQVLQSIDTHTAVGINRCRALLHSLLLVDTPGLWDHHPSLQKMLNARVQHGCTLAKTPDLLAALDARLAPHLTAGAVALAYAQGAGYQNFLIVHSFVPVSILAPAVQKMGIAGKPIASTHQLLNILQRMPDRDTIRAAIARPDAFAALARDLRALVTTTKQRTRRPFDPDWHTNPEVLAKQAARAAKKAAQGAP